jgi:hypothetical protein
MLTKEFAAKEKLEIVQPACLPDGRQAGRQVRKGRFCGRAEGGFGGYRQLENATFCTITRQHSPLGLRFLKTAQELEKNIGLNFILGQKRASLIF